MSSMSKKITQPPEKIAIIAKRCPENITLVVKCVKLLFAKVLRKKKKKKKVVTAETIKNHAYFF